MRKIIILLYIFYIVYIDIVYIDKRSYRPYTQSAGRLNTGTIVLVADECYVIIWQYNGFKFKMTLLLNCCDLYGLHTLTIINLYPFPPTSYYYCSHDKDKKCASDEKWTYLILDHELIMHIFI